MIPLTEAAETAGLSYRQVDFAVRAGYINATFTTRTGEPLDEFTRARLQRGEALNGYTRVVTDHEAGVIATYARLVGAGFQPASAARLARELIATGHADLGHFTVTLREGTGT